MGVVVGAGLVCWDRVVAVCVTSGKTVPSVDATRPDEKGEWEIG